MFPVELKEFATGSYNSELREGVGLSNVVIPPASSTFPLESRVALWVMRGETIGIDGEKELVCGSKRIALPEIPKELDPPASSTLPLPKRVAVCPPRAEGRNAAVAVNVPVAGS